MNKTYGFKKENGQAVVSLLFFMIFAITITTGAVSIVLTNSLAATKLEQGTQTYYLAESGIENALVRLLLDPNYSGETLSFAGGNTVVQVTGTNPKTIISETTSGSFKRKIQVVADYSNHVLAVQSWREI